MSSRARRVRSDLARSRLLFAGEVVTPFPLGFVFGLAVMASPLSVSAQAVDEGTEPTVAEPASAQPAPSIEGAPEEPALQLKLDDAGVEVVPSPPRTYTIEEISEIREMERRV